MPATSLTPVRHAVVSKTQANTSAGAAVQAAASTDRGRRARVRSPMSEPSIEALRQQAKLAFLRAEQLGLESDLLRKALGVGEKYFARLRLIADGKARVSERLERISLNRRALGALEGIVQVFEQASRAIRVRTVQEYEADVIAAFATLTRGDRLTLISGPPPLEWRSMEVVRAALLAARQGATIRYYVPSPDLIARERATLYLQPSRGQEKSRPEPGDLESLRRSFGWFKDLDGCHSIMRENFEVVARRLHKDPRGRVGESDRDASQADLRVLQTQIQFYTLSRWPLTFLQKLCFVERGLDQPPPDDIQPNLVKECSIETLLPNCDGDGSTSIDPYADHQRWSSDSYPCEALVAHLPFLKAFSARLESNE